MSLKPSCKALWMAHFFFFHRSSEWKRAFWNAQDRGVWSPWSPVCLSMSQSIGGWPWISWWGGGVFVSMADGALSLSHSLSLSLFLSLCVQEVPQTQTTLSVLCFRPGHGLQRGSGQAWVSLPGWSGPANVYDLNQPNPTGLFKGIENDLQELQWPGIGNQRKSRQSFKSVVALWLCFASIYLA